MKLSCDLILERPDVGHWTTSLGSKISYKILSVDDEVQVVHWLNRGWSKLENEPFHLEPHIRPKLRRSSKRKALPKPVCGGNSSANAS